MLKHGISENPDVVVISSDEKLFSVEPKFNPQSSRVLSRDLSTVDLGTEFAYSF